MTSALGAMLGIGYGNRLMNDEAKKRMEAEKMRRQSPTLTEQSGELQNMDPNALENLMRLGAHETNADRELSAANAEYAKSGKNNILSDILGIENLKLRQGGQERLNDAQVNQQANNLYQEISPFQALLNQINEAENVANINLDDMDASGNIAGKQVDAPGVQIAGMTLPSVSGSNAEEMKANLQKSLLFKQLSERIASKDRVADFGKTLTGHELASYLNQSGAGLMNWNDRERMLFFKNLKDMARKSLKQAEIMYPQGVRNDPSYTGYDYYANNKGLKFKKNPENGNQKNTPDPKGTTSDSHVTNRPKTRDEIRKELGLNG